MAEKHLQEAAEHYSQLGSQTSEIQQAAQAELGGLLARLIADIHTAVHAEVPLTALERGALCWRGYGLGQRHRALPIQRESWLVTLEEQLVREGCITLRKLATNPDENLNEISRERLRRQALEMALHLSQLHDPCPDWIGLAARELLILEWAPLLAKHPDEIAPADLGQMINWLQRLPVTADAAIGVESAVLRCRLALEVLEYGFEAPSATQKRPTQAIEISQPKPSDNPAPTGAIEDSAPGIAQKLHFSQWGELAQHLHLECVSWINQHAGGEKPVQLQLTVEPLAPPVQQQANSITLNLAPLLEFPSLELLDKLVSAFFAPLEQEARSRFRLQEPNGAIYAALAQLWQRGGGLKPRGFPTLIYASELWNRCGGPGGLGAYLEPWQLPVAELKPGANLLRPGNVELAALQSVLNQTDSLEEALVEIRRHHHDRAWMERRSETWWMDPADPVENLCRLHTNAGFYASGHAPLESLQRWGQATIAALLSGQVLFGNDSIVRMFLPVAQALQRQSGRVPELVQWPGIQALYDFIGDQELMFVTPLAAEVEAQHRSGRAFALFTDIRIRPYGLRCIPAPMSVYPNRPDRGFEDSLERCLEQVERAYRQRPFTVFTAASGAYGLPLCQAVHRRYGVSCLYVGNQMHAYFGVAQNTTDNWMDNKRRPGNWIRATGLNNIPGINRIENGRYLS